MKINPGNARGLLVPQGDRPFSFVVYSSEIRDFGLITNKQRPTWLKEHPKITVVDHTEIIPSELLPTFSSVVIENYLTKIPGLNEHFLYFNDDMFINRHLSPREFFDGDKPIVWMADEYFGRFPENISVEDNIRIFFR